MSQDQQNNALEFFPITMFATTMGLSGLTIVSHRLGYLFEAMGLIYQILAFASLGIYLLILATYTLKSLKYPHGVLADWNHPIKISFFPAASISLLLLGAAFFPLNERLSFFLWATGAFFQFFLSLAIVNSWINHARYEIVHSTPAWFIPAVGNIIVPVIGVEHASAELSWFFFAWGILFWVILLTLIINRLMFHNPIPQKLMPTLFILLAPPSIGFVSYMQLVGELDILGRLIYYWACFFFILLLSQVHRLIKIKFAMSWWAYSFPLTAFSAASLIMGERTGEAFFSFLGTVVFALAFLVIAGLGLRTLRGLFKGEICIPD